MYLNANELTASEMSEEAFALTETGKFFFYLTFP